MTEYEKFKWMSLVEALLYPALRGSDESSELIDTLYIDIFKENDISADVFAKILDGAKKSKQNKQTNETSVSGNNIVSLMDFLKNKKDKKK